MYCILTIIIVCIQHKKILSASVKNINWNLKIYTKTSRVLQTKTGELFLCWGAEQRWFHWIFQKKIRSRFPRISKDFLEDCLDF